MKTSLLLLLTFAASLFVHQGLFLPKAAEASVVALNAWPATPQIVSNAATGTVTGTVTVSAGTNRVMLVAVGAEYTATPATQPMTVTYGGKPVTQLQSNFSGPNTIWLGFIKEADLASATGTTLSVTNGNTTGLTAMYASAAVYSGVDQTTPISGSNSVATAAAVSTMNLPAINVKGATGNTALSFYVSNRNLQSQTVDAAYTQNVQYLGTNFYMAFNTITTAPAALTTTAPAVTTATASLGAAVSVALVPSGVAGIGALGSCASCHGNPPVDAATARNNPAGQFRGSHNKHSGTGANQYQYVCTRCHRDNRTFNHSNTRINMRVPINGTTGAIYNNVTSFNVTNTPTFGTCANTYCHSNGTGGTTQTGDTRAVVANTSLTWGTVGGNNFATNCSTTCHSGRPSYTNYTGVITANKKANAHVTGATHNSKTCDVCHSSVTTGDSGVTYNFTSYTTHNNGRYNLKPSLGYTYAAKKGGTCATPGCHGSMFWGGKLGCINCHNVTVNRTVGPAAGNTLSAVVGEFGLKYGHFASKRTNFGALTDAVCVVCHLEGWGYGDVNFGKPNATYHQNGYIDLRDPQGAGETPITNISGGAFTFARFSTSYAAGSRTTTGHLSNTDIANVITQKFCLACHRASGATNPRARISSTSTAYRPWGFGNFTTIGNNYTVANGAAVRGGLINTFRQFSTANSSVHPVRAPLNRDFPIATRLAVPYNAQGAGRVAAGYTKSLSVVINCFDCHNSNVAPLLTLRTNIAHGNNRTAMVRGTFYVSGPTLCTACHTGYTSTSNHGSGSAMNGSSDGSEGFNTTCHNCHASNTALPARPVPAADYHGFNALLSGGNWPAPGARPFGFLRNTVGWGTAYHRPYRSTEFTTGSATCGGNSTGCQVGNGSVRTYLPGGSY